MGAILYDLDHTGVRLKKRRPRFLAGWGLQLWECIASAFNAFPRDAKSLSPSKNIHGPHSPLVVVCSCGVVKNVSLCWTGYLAYPPGGVR